MELIDAEEIERHGCAALEQVDCVLAPGGFGSRGVEGKVRAARFAREREVPYLGICLGMQVAVIEFARNAAALAGANSTEFDRDARHPVIALLTEWIEEDGEVQHREDGGDLGGTMRLGAQEVVLAPGTRAREAYGEPIIEERHRHRYEFNNRYLERLRDAGLVISATTADGELVEMVELSDHPWYVGCQFHPEFTSNARDGHRLFEAFVRAAMRYRERRSGARDGVALEPGRAGPPDAGNGSDGDSVADTAADPGSDSAAGDTAEAASGRADLAQPVH